MYYTFFYPLCQVKRKATEAAFPMFILISLN